MKKNKNFINFLISLYNPVKIITVIMIISIILSQILNILKTYIIKSIIDLPTNPSFKLVDLYHVSLILIIVIIAEIIFFYTSSIIREIIMKKKQTPYIAEKLFNNLNRKKYSFFVDNYSGKITSSINEIIDETIALNSSFSKSFISVLTLIISNLIVLWTIDFKIFTTAFILYFGIIITRLIYFFKRYLPLIKKSQEINREYNGVLSDAVLNFNSLKVYNAVKEFSKVLKSKKQEVNIYSNKATIREFSYGAVANIIYVITLSTLILYSINLYSNSIITLGDFIFFLNAMIALKSATTTFCWAFIEIGEHLVRIKNSYELLYIDNNDDNDKKEDIVITNGNIKIDSISFKYNKDYIFKDFSLDIKNKEKIGIIGISGSGKTTLVNLLFKFYDIEKGKILIDNKDISNYNSLSLYNNLTFVPQETILLHSSILDNIKIAKPDASIEEIMEAAKKAELDSFINTLENGYETIVGERGVKLSGGQRQRIALARIFLKNSKIIVFDEATSSLDNNTEFKIQQNIDKYFNNQTIICIAHRLSTLKDMDKIVVINDGKIIEIGTPKEIIPKYDTIKGNDFIEC